ncbi:MAG: hypothetical protein IKY48_06875 [Bacteroidales bacterium]|nr:hypothetical protein [Bacteroidales bacterium]
MDRLTAFVSEHINDDTTRLIMNRAKWPEIDMDMAVNCIESRRKLKGKIQEWCDEPRLVFPRRLSAEQCSSSATGAYKAYFAARIVSGGFKLADLTGGLGVDSWFFSKKASQVLYHEMLPELCKAAEHNFGVLGADNITVRNVAVSVESGSADEVFRTPTEILSDIQPDIVYMDPARRGEGGKKVFLLEDCLPDVLTLKDEIFKYTKHILLKLSPMADITMVCDRLGKTCREVHVVAAGGECKELLVWMDKEWDSDYTIQAVELHKDGEPGVFSFVPAEEKACSVVAGKIPSPGSSGECNLYLFEPGKALMKAGAFNLVAERFGLSKLGKSTHYYIFSGDGLAPQGGLHDELQDGLSQLKRHGKVFRIMRLEPLDKRSIKAFGKDFPKAEVTARNVPMDTDTLRKKLGVTSGDDAHIFGLKSDSHGNLLIAGEVLR